jgi:CRP/FNR family transcriptional regulator, cyclic AMP receptor protein
MFKQATVAQTLRNIPWLLELSQEQIDRLAELASYQPLALGEDLFREGASEDNIYILLEGQVCLEIAIPTQGIIKIGLIEPLDIVGWSALTPVVRQRTATARACQPGMAITLNGDALRKLCDSDHDLGYLIFRRLSNVIATRLLTTRLHLYDMVIQTARLNSESNNYVP